ncbi:hypothetical protein OHA79_51110 (plasmid) [Streptomyces sp. NBC_00841]|uniref:hypothetical protein n=1 Tax=Streptomyces sp. NBC_00841 TaxID=2975847 RepID=UPI002DD90603|nr:hypothetical protein [Streptomyces sp. NBC_00841]WSA05766.1 hypothetical protein OHA79_51110 [Streptomyces sp. NBC_00841]
MLDALRQHCEPECVAGVVKVRAEGREKVISILAGTASYRRPATEGKHQAAWRTFGETTAQ